MTNEAIKTFQYRITQATASQLVVILYDMELEYIKDAEDAITEIVVGNQDNIVVNSADNKNGSDDKKNRDAARKNIHMAAKVIDQLLVGLNMEYEISKELFMIYNHVKRTLISVSVSMDKTELERISGLILKLRKSFYEVSKLDNSAPLMKNTETVYSGLTYSRGGIGNEYNLTGSEPANNRGFKA